MLQDGGKTLTRLTQNFKRMLPSGKGGDAGETAQEGPAPQRKGLGRLKARFLSKESPTVDVPPSSFDYEGSMGFPEVTTVIWGHFHWLSTCPQRGNSRFAGAWITVIGIQQEQEQGFI